MAILPLRSYPILLFSEDVVRELLFTDIPDLKWFANVIWSPKKEESEKEKPRTYL